MDLNDLDENGWARIHHSAYHGLIQSITRMVGLSKDQLELETGDELHSTPLLLAVMSGNLETVKYLIDLGARLNARNSQGHGVVELSCLGESLEMLYFFLTAVPNLPVWVHLIQFATSMSDDESIKAGACLRALLSIPLVSSLGNQQEIQTKNPFWEPAIKAGIVKAIAKIISNDVGEDTKSQVLLTLHNLIHLDGVCADFVASGGVAPLIRLFRPPTNPLLVQLASQTVLHLARSHQATVMVQAGVIPALVRILGGVGLEEEARDEYAAPDLLRDVLRALTSLAEDNEAHQTAVCRESGCATKLVTIFSNLNRDLLMAATSLVCALSNGHPANQEALVTEGVTQPIITLTRVKSRELQLAAADAIRLLADNNPTTQAHLLTDGAVKPLLTLIRRAGRAAEVQERVAGALWAIAGRDPEAKREIAHAIGIHQLIDYLQYSSAKLHLIVCEAIWILARSPGHERDEIGAQNGVAPLVRLLRSDQEAIVLAAVRAIGALCVGIGYQPQQRNQNHVTLTRGIKLLVALMVHARDELIRVEAAVALACSALGNVKIQAELQSNVEFTYIRVLKLLYSDIQEVRLHAGTALATFAYNSLSQQHAIAQQGGIRFQCLLPFLDSADQYEKCMAAFQVVVLARIIPDEEQALSSAEGIKILVDLLDVSVDPEILALGADCVARLAHTRAGVPQAMISIGVVEILCRHLRHAATHVRGSAAVAIAYLSHYPEGRRRVLNQFRRDPFLMEALHFYTTSSKIDTQFIEGWRHYKRVGLPRIDREHVQLTARKDIDFFKDPIGRQFTMNSDDYGVSGDATMRLPPIPPLPPIVASFLSGAQQGMTGQLLSRRKSLRLIEQAPDTNAGGMDLIDEEDNHSELDEENVMVEASSVNSSSSSRIRKEEFEEIDNNSLPTNALVDVQ